MVCVCVLGGGYVLHHFCLVLCVCAHMCACACSTLCDPMDCSRPGSSVHGIFQARILKGIVISYSQGSFPTQGSNPCLLHLLNWQGILYHCPTQEAPSFVLKEHKLDIP